MSKCTSFKAGVVGAGFSISSTTRATAKEMPDAAKCMADVNAKANALLEKQNAAADRAHEWADKGDAYVTILTRVKG
jgi:hypothetical protein